MFNKNKVEIVDFKKEEKRRQRKERFKSKIKIKSV